MIVTEQELEALEESTATESRVSWYLQAAGSASRDEAHRMTRQCAEYYNSPMDGGIRRHVGNGDDVWTTVWPILVKFHLRVPGA